MCECECKFESVGVSVAMGVGMSVYMCECECECKCPCECVKESVCACVRMNVLTDICWGTLEAQVSRCSGSVDEKRPAGRVCDRVRVILCVSVQVYV